MQNEEYWEALLEKAGTLVAELLDSAGVAGGVTVEWFYYGARIETAAPYWVDRGRKSIGLNRSIVEQWIGWWLWPAELTRQQVEARLAGLALRAAAAFLFAPPSDLWREAVDRHLRSEHAKGCNGSYWRAFMAASAILEGHRLDRQVLVLVPDAGDVLAELVRFDLEEHPAIDTYPRTAIVIGRPHLPDDLVQPAFAELIKEFGVDEASELGYLLNIYVTLSSDDIDEMVEQTSKLVFHAFPEAMGLGRIDDEDGPTTDALPGSTPGSARPRTRSAAANRARSASANSIRGTGVGQAPIGTSGPSSTGFR